MSAPDRIRRRVVVHGRVQGVTFRGSTAEAARSAGVEGWVRNQPDGTVTAVFEGEATAVGGLVDFCRRGPSWAAVESVEVFEEPPEDIQGFRIV